METKTSKFILKTLLFFPIGFGIWSFRSSFDFNDLTFHIVAGLVISFGIVFWQLFDYEKFNDIKYEDFLESKHKLSFENTAENWEKIEDMLKTPFANLKVIKKNESFLKVKIERRFQNSILIIQKIEEEIIVEIEKEFLTFLPDNADNYRTIKNISKGIKAVPEFVEL